MMLEQLRFILDLTHDFNGLGKGNCKTRRETFKFGDSVASNIRDLTVYMNHNFLYMVNSGEEVYGVAKLQIGS